MKKAVMFLVLFLVCFNVSALRQVQVGESFKKSPLNEKILTNEKKILVFLNGNKRKNEKMLKTLDEVLKNLSVKVKVFFIKTMNVDYPVLNKLLASNSDYVLIEDFKRKLYGEFGVIVLPTVLFVNEEQVLIAEISGNIPNAKLVFEADLKALLNNSIPEDVYAKIKKEKIRGKKEKSVRQAFLMFVNGNYGISLSIFQRLYNQYPDDKRIVLGYAYSLMLNGDSKKAKEILKQAKDAHSNKRFDLAYCYASFLEGGTMEDLKGCAENINFEPDFFSVIFQIGKDFEKNGMCEEALKCYKEAYKVLWKRYRRGK